MAIAHLSVKVGSVGKASSHAEYIEREGKYAKKKEQDNDLEYSATGNMPTWAEHKPIIFWQSADLFERKNGSTYREYEIALPRELNREQRIDLVESFVQQEIDTKYPYQWAIHNPKAMDGEQQPHVHLMFNERLRDGIERDPQHYFKRYNSKTPEQGGAKKDNTGKDPKTRREELQALRQRWETITNQHLERAGITERIDMRSYQDQGIDKTPEKKLLPSQGKDPNIRQAMTEIRQAEKFIQKIDLAEIKQQFAALKTSQQQEKATVQPEIPEKPPQMTTEMREGMNRARQRFEQMKAEKILQAQKQQKEEQREQEQSQDRGMSR